MGLQVALLLTALLLAVPEVRPPAEPRWPPGAALNSPDTAVERASRESELPRLAGGGQPDDVDPG